MKSLSNFALLGVLLLAWGCQTVNPLVREAKTSIASADFQTALEKADQALAENPNDGLAHYYRGVALGSIGQETEAPEERLPFYQQMMEALGTATAIFDTTENVPAEADNISAAITSTWAAEHNQAVDILTNDSLAGTYADPNATAIAHLKNAVTLAPDSSMSYTVLASAYYRTNDIPAATEAYETAMSLIDSADVGDYEFLITLYLSSQRYDDVREKSMEALELYPDETSFVQYLADSYLQTGDTDKAVELIRELIAKDPENPQYHLVLGTQLYQSVDEMTDEFGAKLAQIYDLRQASRSLRGAEKAQAEADIEALQAEADALEAEVNSLTDLSIEEIQAASDLDPQNPSIYNILGIIYQNRSALWFDKRNNTSDYDLADEYDATARELLQLSRQSYEKAVEFDPENRDYWRSLFQVYTTLGMTEEAEMALQKAEG